ncbi:hypothetical protein GBA52_020530 [Prunus armeniaca]|nr:hypothetical protein GBA52_020530 [Prunus armeniaca]
MSQEFTKNKVNIYANLCDICHQYKNYQVLNLDASGHDWLSHQHLGFQAYRDGLLCLLLHQINRCSKYEERIEVEKKANKLTMVESFAALFGSNKGKKQHFISCQRRIQHSGSNKEKQQREGYNIFLAATKGRIQHFFGSNKGKDTTFFVP